MDLLEAEHAAIEEEVFWQTASLLNLDVDLIFYDTTSLHFEIGEEDTAPPEKEGEPPPPRKRGKSKNGRSDAPLTDPRETAKKRLATLEIEPPPRILAMAQPLRETWGDLVQTHPGPICGS